MRERVKTELEIRKRIKDLEVLRSVSLDISAGRERSELYSTIAVSAATLLGCDAAGISQFDVNKHKFTFPFVYNLPERIGKSELKLDSDVFSHVINSGRAIFVNDYKAAPGRIKRFVDAGIQAIAVTPLKMRGEILALLWAASFKPGRPFSDYDMVLLESIGGQAAVAIDNINLFQEQRYISEVLQKGFLPERLPIVERTDIGIFYESATEAAVVGGDFYDFIPLEEGRKICFTLGDSSGKGVEATSDAAMVKYTMRSSLFRNPDPSSALDQGNFTAMRQLTDGHFVTLLYGYYDSEAGLLLLGNAGHPHPIYYSSSNKEAVPITDHDPAFGLIKDYSYSKTELSLSPGDILVFYTDGLLELRRDKEFFGIERLSNIVNEYSALTAQELADKVIDLAREFSMGRFIDDIVLMVLKRT